MSRRRVTGFRFGGVWRELRDPDGRPTDRQLARLNAAGMLELVAPGEAEPITKAQAAAGIDDAEPVWLMRDVLPAGAAVVVADLDDDLDAIRAAGVDVVLLMRDSSDRLFAAGEPFAIEVLWRPGLVHGRTPPAPFWVRFDPASGGFVRVDEPEAA